MSCSVRRGAIILLYHRVAELPSDPQSLAVTPEHFEKQLQFLRRRAKLISLGQLAHDLHDGRVQDGSVVITFDDGYADNALQAAPILRRLRVPATMFVTTAYTGLSREFFWDELERIFLSPGELPVQLHLPLVSGEFFLDLGKWSVCTPQEMERWKNWNVLAAKDPTPRHRAYRRLCALLYQQTVSQRRDLLDRLRDWAGVDANGRSSHRMMSTQELRDVARDGLIEIGGHTTDHPRLSSESIDSQREQIGSNKAAVESILSRPVTSFSYPFGTRHDFTPQTVALLKQAGYADACANFSGLVSAQAYAYQLPRVIVRNWTAEQFERQLALLNRPRASARMAAGR